MLEVKNLTFRYESYESTSSRVLLNNVSFTLRKNENILILGRPGAGKTTLSFILSGLTPKYNDGELTGTVLYGGKGVDEALEELTVFSLVPQNTADSMITSTVEEELAFPLESLGMDVEEMERRITEVCSGWGLERLRYVGTQELSGGEKRRLMLACAEVTDPDYMIYDEAFDDLDVSYREKLAKILQKRERASIVTASHFLSCFTGLFDEVYILDGTLKRADSHMVAAFSEIPRMTFPPVTSDDVLSVRDLKFTHPHRSISEEEPFRLTVPEFSLRRGEVITLTGPNGSGKSTFSSLLCGLYAPEYGVIAYSGRSLDRKELARTVGYMFQNPDWQIFLPTVRDELSFAYERERMKRSETDAKVDELTRLFNLDPGSIATMMSYGERKRLQAAVYYSLKRPFCILDELDSALSYDESASLITLLAAQGAGIILITHDEAFARAVSDRGYSVKDGVVNAL